MPYLVKILVEKKPGVLNPEAKAIEGATASLGYNISEFSCGREFSYKSSKSTEKQARAEADELSKKLLANMIVKRYEIVSVEKLV
ncbi:MAG: phosphoribosylformylglycinamidine synthase subunit PurS [Nanoarchaeota archaeon]